MIKTKYNQTLMIIEIIPQSIKVTNFHTSGIHIYVTCYNLLKVNVKFHTSSILSGHFGVTYSSSLFCPVKVSSYSFDAAEDDAVCVVDLW